MFCGCACCIQCKAMADKTRTPVEPMAQHLELCALHRHLCSACARLCIPASSHLTVPSPCCVCSAFNSCRKVCHCGFSCPGVRAEFCPVWMCVIMRGSKFGLITSLKVAPIPVITWW